MRESRVIVNHATRIKSLISVHDGTSLHYADAVSVSATVRFPNGATQTITGAMPTAGNAFAMFAAAQAGDTELIAEEITGEEFLPALYVVQDAITKRRFIVEVASIIGERYTLRTALPCDISHGSLIEPAEVFCDVTSEQNNLTGVGVVQWTIEDTVGTQFTWSDTFQVVKRMPHWALNQSKLLQQWPWIARHRDRADVDLSNLVQTGLELYILPLLRARGIAEEDILTTSLLEPAHSTACAYHVALNDGSVEDARREEYKRRIHTLIDNALASPGWFESPQTKDAAVPVANGPPDGRRYVRLVR